MTDAILIGEHWVSPEGEILEIPEGVGDIMEWLSLQDAEAAANLDGWTQRRALLKARMEQELIRNGLQSARTRFGTVRIVEPSTTESGRSERVPEIVREFELGREAELAIWQTAKTLDVKALRAIPVSVVPAPVREALIESSPKKGYIRRDPPREVAPEVRR